MNGIPGCGDGAWTQVMRINGSKVSFEDFENQSLKRCVIGV